MKVLLVLITLLGACAPVAVQRVKPDDFNRYNIPRRIVIFKGNNSPETGRTVNEIGASFASAGFTVVSREEAAKALGTQNVTPDDLVARSEFAPLCTTAGVDAVVLIQQYYDTELKMLEAKTGKVLASGCWRTSYITIVNEVIDQLKRKESPSPRLCPVPVQK